MRGSAKRLMRDNLHYWAFLAVPVALYLVFYIYPNLQALYYSFFKIDDFGGVKEFIGLRNYFMIFTGDPEFNEALRNTFLYTLYLVVFQNVLSLLISLGLVKKTRVNKAYRTMFYLPVIFSSVVVAYIWGFIYDPTIGILTSTLKSLGLGALNRTWLTDAQTALPTVVIVHIWSQLGTGMVLYIAGLQNMSPDLYEAGDIEGANAWQRFWHITFPQLLPVTVIVLILTMLGGFKSFDLVYVLTGGGFDNSTLLLALKLYQEGFRYYHVGYASAIAVILTVLVSVFSFIQTVVFRDKT